MTAAISVRDLTRSFDGSRALDRVSLRVEAGEMVALIGASGSGKSTLLRHIAGLATADAQDDGCAVRVFGRCVQQGGRLAPDIRDLRAGIGFVFQQFNLVGRLPLITNVLAGMLHRVPAWRSAFRHFTRDETALGIAALARVGMAERAYQRTSTLSGGQQQRAAIARTLVQQARVVLADEPVASLDPETARGVMDTLAGVNRTEGVTVVVSLHQVEFATRYCARTVALRRGRVVYDGPSAALTAERLGELYGAESSAPRAGRRPNAARSVGLAYADPHPPASGADAAVRAQTI